RIGRICPGLPIGLPGPGLSTPPVLSLGTEKQKEEYFQRFLNKDRPVWGCFAITEPQSGSDATAMRTTAKRDGNTYILNGDKCFITCGARADVVVVFATLNPDKGRFGIRAFVVPRETPGFTISSCEEMMGLRASQLASLSFDDCVLPAEYMLGWNGKRGPWIDAFTGAQNAWDYMRPVLASMMNGSSAGILDYAERCLDSGDHILSRAMAGGARNQISKFRARCYASQLLALRAAWKFDHGESTSMDASMAKACASSLGTEVAHSLASLFPVHAATAGNRIEKYYRDAKAFDIIEGTGDMQRLLIARSYDNN
ncbi:MAG: acyl-CoA dehydrogenase family protein, partial [Myxococcota bacterium]